MTRLKKKVLKEEEYITCGSDRRSKKEMYAVYTIGMPLGRRIEEVKLVKTGPIEGQYSI